MGVDTDRMVWQPLMVIVPQRIECQCGAKAVFVVLDDPEAEGDKTDYGYTGWCQDCWQHEQEKYD